jgi:hypothetical protein
MPSRTSSAAGRARLADHRLHAPPFSFRTCESELNDLPRREMLFAALHDFVRNCDRNPRHRSDIIEADALKLVLRLKFLISCSFSPSSPHFKVGASMEQFCALQYAHPLTAHHTAVTAASLRLRNPSFRVGSRKNDDGRTCNAKTSPVTHRMIGCASTSLGS